MTVSSLGGGLKGKEYLFFLLAQKNGCVNNEVDHHGSPPLSSENERKLGSRIAVLPCMVKSHSHSSMKTARGQRPCSAHPSLTTTRHQLDEAVHTMKSAAAETSRLTTDCDETLSAASCLVASLGPASASPNSPGGCACSRGDSPGHRRLLGGLLCAARSAAAFPASKAGRFALRAWPNRLPVNSSPQSSPSASGIRLIASGSSDDSARRETPNRLRSDSATFA